MWHFGLLDGGPAIGSDHDVEAPQVWVHALEAVARVCDACDTDATYGWTDWCGSLPLTATTPSPSAGRAYTASVGSPAATDCRWMLRSMSRGLGGRYRSVRPRRLRLRAMALAGTTHAAAAQARRWSGLDRSPYRRHGCRHWCAMSAHRPVGQDSGRVAEGSTNGRRIPLRQRNDRAGKL